MKLKIRRYDVEITATCSGCSETSTTLALLDQIANGCGHAAMYDTDEDHYWCGIWSEIADDIHEAIEEAGLYT